MDERDQKRQLIDAETEGTGRLRGGVEMAQMGVDRARLAVEDAGWFLRERVAWPVEDGLDRLGTRGTIGVFGGGGIAVAGVVAALLIAGSGGSSSSAGRTEAFVVPQRSPAPAALAPAPKPKKRAMKPTGPTLHGAPPDFFPAKDVRTGVADGKALGGKRGSGSDQASAARGAASDGTGGAAAEKPAATGSSANDTPASTAKIGANPAATASAQAQADSLATQGAGTGRGTAADEAVPAGGAVGTTTGSGGDETGGGVTGPPAPKAAKQVARRFADAFVVYEVGGVDGKVRKTFGQTSTKQLSRSLLRRPPRQPASVEVPQAKVVNVVAGPSRGSVYTISVSLLRVGVTSELRLEMEQGVGKKWQVTNVLG
jgi:hypothetical protein